MGCVDICQGVGDLRATLIINIFFHEIFSLYSRFLRPRVITKISRLNN